MSLHRKIKSDQLPKTQTKRKQSTPRASLKAVPSYESNIKLPQITDVPKGSQEGLFVRKLKICAVTFNFLDCSEMKEKQLKFSTLKELVVFIQEKGNVSAFTEDTYRQILNMVAENIFRTFPPVDSTDYEPEYDEQTQEAAWPHLKLVYDLLLHFINSPEVNVLYFKKVMDRSFITKLLELFNSEDGRERKCLKNLLLSIYLKLFDQRAFIRKHIRNVFLRYIYEVEQFNGISELLEILAMAINGFNVPLRQEHKDFLSKVLVPLHKPRYLAFYQKSLMDCLKGYIRKDENTVEVIILGVLRFWPKTCTDKEVLFIQEIVEFLEIIANNQFVKIQVPLIKQISRCVSSLHFQVAETALNLWENQDFMRHFTINTKTLMPIVFPYVYRISRNHWNSNISETASAVLKIFSEVDSALFSSLAASTKSKTRKGKPESRGINKR